MKVRLITVLLISLLAMMASGCGTKEENAKGNEDTMENIWAIEDEYDFITALYDYLDGKCGGGENLEALSRQERVIYVTQTLEMEINGGGFDQYFFNSAGNSANEVSAAYAEIGAVKTAAICQRAVDAFGGEIPSDWSERQDVMEEYESEERSEIWNECDSAFNEYEENLGLLSYEYVMKNKENFK